MSTRHSRVSRAKSVSAFEVSLPSRKDTRFLVPRAAVRARPLQHLEVAAPRRVCARLPVPRKIRRSKCPQRLELSARSSLLLHKRVSARSPSEGLASACPSVSSRIRAPRHPHLKPSLPHAPSRPRRRACRGSPREADRDPRVPASWSVRGSRASSRRGGVCRTWSRQRRGGRARKSRRHRRACRECARRRGV